MAEKAKACAGSATARLNSPAARAVGTAVALLAGAATLLAQGRSFTFLQPGFTQELFGVTSTFVTPNAYLGGVATLPNGDVIAAECVIANTALHRFLAVSTTQRNSTAIHDEVVLPTQGGCGVVYHPDGTLYLNMNDGAHGVANVDPNTGAVLRLMGRPGNSLGIAVDPRTRHVVYAGADCVAGLSPTTPNTCTLIDVDPVTGQSFDRAIFATSEVGYIGGINFDPTGNFIFLDNRFPFTRLTVLTRTGTIVQHIAVASEPIGIAFHTSPDFVVTNNVDGTMTRFDFPGNNYAQPPAISVFADGGFRGDLMQVGRDGCLYLTQLGTRYNNFVETAENSIVRICGGFAPPPGIVATPAQTDVALAAHGPATATAGSAVTVTFTAANTSTTAASNVVFTLPLPSQTTFVSLVPAAGWTCTTPAPGSGGTIRCTTSALAPGAAGTFTLRVAPACPFPAAPLVLTGTVTTTTPERSTANNTARFATAIGLPTPTISNITVSRKELWPPNHKMVPVDVTYTLSGATCAGLRTTLTVKSNQRGKFLPEFTIVDAHHLLLRSERNGNEGARVYTITITALIGDTVVASRSVTIVVPHDQR